MKRSQVLHLLTRGSHELVWYTATTSYIFRRQVQRQAPSRFEKQRPKTRYFDRESVPTVSYDNCVRCKGYTSLRRRNQHPLFRYSVVSFFEEAKRANS
ncbi:hypothetical protein N7516_007692 [Penicillium verrucosum]|uniref:uncharacterized protein n=1 Tax=Penicillium verrucosum TaxID=60171 RepID=UPI0025458CC4|nr:uncharacterized protein N7516_007692 [Penicillium verrucosum]KAJ5933203.1 hypothetical protein N7516_007692 [Penicillium verrucosum]